MDITSLIEASNKTRAEIIREVGFSQGYLSLLESGQRSVGKSYLAPLATALGVSPAVLRPDWSAFLIPSSDPALVAASSEGSLPTEKRKDAKTPIQDRAPKSPREAAE